MTFVDGWVARFSERIATSVLEQHAFHSVIDDEFVALAALAETSSVHAVLAELAHVGRLREAIRTKLNDDYPSAEFYRELESIRQALIADLGSRGLQGEETGLPAALIAGWDIARREFCVRLVSILRARQAE